MNLAQEKWYILALFWTAVVLIVLSYMFWKSEHYNINALQCHENAFIRYRKDTKNIKLTQDEKTLSNADKAYLRFLKEDTVWTNAQVQYYTCMLLHDVPTDHVCPFSFLIAEPVQSQVFGQ